MMMRRFMLVIVALVLAVLQAGFLTALPQPLASLNLPIILIVLLVADFHLADALLVAVVSGLCLDAMSSLPAGIMTIVMVGVTLTAYALLTRIITNQSLPALLGMQLIAFLAWELALMAVRGARATLLGWSWSDVGVWASGHTWLTAALVQILVAAVFMMLGRRLAKLTSSLVIVASRPVTR